MQRDSAQIKGDNQAQPEAELYPPQPWHALEPAVVQQKLETTPEGLADAEARRRLAQYRPNRLAPPKRRSALVRLLMQFHNILLYVMLGSVDVSHW